MSALFDLDEYVDGQRDRFGILWCRSSAEEVNPLLDSTHYLGPRDSGMFVFAGINQERTVVAAQVWGTPSSRRLPNDGSWLELARWCLTPEAGKNAGSRQHSWVVRWLRKNAPQVTTLVSYSDPSQGHTGALYRSCNWMWRPTWHRLSPPPSGNGRWTRDSDIESVKDRWVFAVRKDDRRDELASLDPDQSYRSVRKALASDIPDWQRRELERILHRHP